MDMDFPGSNPLVGIDISRVCSVESWTVRLLIELVPVFLMVIEKAALPFVSLIRFAD